MRPEHVSGKEIERAENEIRAGRGEYFGQFRLRVNSELHRRLAELAVDRNASLNQLIQELLEKQLVGGACTVFQRMNERGDMLRVATTMEKADYSRAIGTYIPAGGPGGKPDPVVSTVLKGGTYRGHAFAVNIWFIEL